MDVEGPGAIGDEEDRVAQPHGAPVVSVTDGQLLDAAVLQAGDPDARGHPAPVVAPVRAEQFVKRRDWHVGNAVALRPERPVPAPR